MPSHGNPLSKDVKTPKVLGTLSGLHIFPITCCVLAMCTQAWLLLQIKTEYWGEIQTSVVVLWIRLKLWWMIAMGVKYNHTKKFEQETQR